MPLLIAPILAGDADMTFGSRFAGMGDPLGGGMPRYRYLGNRITTAAQNLMLGTRFTDMHSGMRAYTRACLESLPFLRYSEGFAFDAELLVDAVTSGQRVVEVPIPTRVHGGVVVDLDHAVARLRVARYHLRGEAGSRPRSARQPLLAGLASIAAASRGKGRSARRDASRAGASACSCATRPRPTGDVPIEEFRCTTSALGVHDDILECPRCGLLSSAPTLRPDEIVAGYEEVVDEEYLSEEEQRRELFGWVSEQTGRVLRARQAAARDRRQRRAVPRRCGRAGLGGDRASSPRLGRSSRAVSASASISGRARSRRSTSRPARSTLS